MKNKIIALALSMLVPCVCASALTIDFVDVDTKTNSVSVKGTAKSGELVLINVLDNEKSGNFLAKLSYQNNTTADKNSEFEFDFKMPDASLYNVIVSTEKESVNKDFVFTDNASASSLREQINLASQEEIKKLLSENRYIAGLFGKDLPEPDYEKIAKLVYENKSYKEDNIGDFIDKMKRFYLITVNESSTVENLYNYKDEACFEKEIFNEVPFTESHQKYATSLIQGKTYKTADEYTKAMEEAAALAVINNPDGYENVQKIIEEFAKEIGIDLSDASASIYRKLQGSKAKSFDELEDEFDELVKAEKKKGSTGGNGGGAGAGGVSTGAYGDIGIIERAEQTKAENSSVSSGFDDLGNFEWARESINALADKGIISGKEPGKYFPAHIITRSEFVKLVVLAFGIEEGENEISFKDTNADNWDYKYIKSAYNAGIVNGMSDEYFGCRESITRQDMAVMIMRASGMEESADGTVFADDEKISAYAKSAVYSLKTAGILNGDEKGEFNPKNPANRAAAAKVIYLAMK